MQNGITDEHIKHARLYIEARSANHQDKAHYERVLHQMCATDAVFAKAMLRARDQMEREASHKEGAA
jgi:hypothetical protein